MIIQIEPFNQTVTKWTLALGYFPTCTVAALWLNNHSDHTNNKNSILHSYSAKDLSEWEHQYVA